MKFYLSSFKLGDKGADLARMLSHNKNIAYIPNACDYTNINREKKTAWEKKDMTSLEDLWLTVTYLDLKNFFGKTTDLRKKLDEFWWIFIRWGNTFILRQAMKLSGFDLLFQEFLQRDDFVYAGYSAWICVLAPDLKSLQTVDDPTDKPYPALQETIWEWLGYLDYMILPHYQSDHPESADIDKEVAYCEKNNIPFKTLRDGEVIIIE